MPALSLLDMKLQYLKRVGLDRVPADQSGFSPYLRRNIGICSVLTAAQRIIIEEPEPSPRDIESTDRVAFTHWSEHSGNQNRAGIRLPLLQ